MFLINNIFTKNIILINIIANCARCLFANFPIKLQTLNSQEYWVKFHFIVTINGEWNCKQVGVRV